MIDPKEGEPLALPQVGREGKPFWGDRLALLSKLSKRG
jgi:hypothetical protein